jgi:thiamine-phosphate pyrophosphorylase
LEAEAEGSSLKIDFQLYLITNRKQTRVPLREAVRHALQGGARAIQLREKDLPVRELLALAETLRAITHEFGAKLFINDRVDIAVGVGADGVHLGHESMPPDSVRKVVGNKLLIGVSTHTSDEAKAAEAGGADFITFGPVFFTQSKAQFGQPAGLEYLKSVKESVNIPVFGLGGINYENMDNVMNCGTHGISLISAIFGADDIRKAAETIAGKLTRCI